MIYHPTAAAREFVWPHFSFPTVLSFIPCIIFFVVDATSAIGFAGIPFATFFAFGQSHLEFLSKTGHIFGKVWIVVATVLWVGLMNLNRGHVSKG